MKNLNHLFLEELADRLDSEKQLVKAMPKLVESASGPELKKLILSHLKETESHVMKLESIFPMLDEKVRTKKCHATVGLLKEGEASIMEFRGTPACDAAIISAAQKVEHYEIASYGCLHEWAKILDESDVAGILQSILDEENGANRALVEVACAHSNSEALKQDSSDKACCADKAKPKSEPAMHQRA